MLFTCVLNCTCLHSICHFFAIHMYMCIHSMIMHLIVWIRFSLILYFLYMYICLYLSFDSFFTCSRNYSLINETETKGYLPVLVTRGTRMFNISDKVYC